MSLDEETPSSEEIKPAGLCIVELHLRKVVLLPMGKYREKLVLNI